jgi:hypothetical protein
VALLAESSTSINQITKLCRVSEHTVRAVREREAVSIADRKQRLVSIFGNVAEIAAERMEELARSATLRDMGTTAGIATDKLLALLGETGGGVPVQINMYTGVAELLQKRYNELVRQMESRTSCREQRVPSKRRNREFAERERIAKSEVASPSG